MSEITDLYSVFGFEFSAPNLVGNKYYELKFKIVEFHFGLKLLP